MAVEIYRVDFEYTVGIVPASAKKGSAHAKRSRPVASQDRPAFKTLLKVSGFENITSLDFILT